ncbi:MAG TPA: hypothetical protein VGM52_00535 [Herbaspirillum sp.]|jgi:hypothetical protein
MDTIFDGGMEIRIKRLEDDLATIKTDVAVIKANYASREDLHKELNAQTWNFVTFVAGIGTALVAATYFIAIHAR